MWDSVMKSCNSASEARPRKTSLLEAQQYCNFVVLDPRALPNNLKLETCFLRLEAPPAELPAAANWRPKWTNSNRCSIRFELSNATCRIRVKQFLYDWAPPAFDHPCLWKTKARPYRVGADVAWCGVDFKGNQAAYISKDRTSVELSVLEGRCQDSNLIEILAGLVAVDWEARNCILSTPLVRLAYCSRHLEPAIAVPTGFFRHHRSPIGHVVAYEAEEVPRHGRFESSLPDQLEGYNFNGAFLVFENGSVVETDFVYEDPQCAGHAIRILVVQNHASADSNGQPALDEQPCLVESWPNKNSKASDASHCRMIHIAYCEKEFGQFEAGLWRDRRLILVMAKASGQLSRARFKMLIDCICAI